METIFPSPDSPARFSKLLVILAAILVCLACSLRAQQVGEAAYTYLGNDRPDEAQPGWHNSGQGLAHDDDNWFITQAMAIWKIPVTNDLSAPATPGVRGVIKTNIGTIEGLAGYDHFGDPECFKSGDQWFLFVAVTSDEGKPDVIAVFSCDSLAYITCTNSPGVDGTVDDGWCAVDPKSGDLLIPNTGNPVRLNRYGVNYDALRTSRRLELTPTTGFISLLGEDNRELPIVQLQGGVMSPSGELLYLSAGITGLWVDGSDFGIHVFQLQSTDPSTHVTKWRRIKRSTNGPTVVFPEGYWGIPWLVYPRFNFSFNPECPGGNCEEVEGLTFWDLDDGRAPGISGQLHVMLVDHRWPWEDQIYLKHYTSAIYVDRAFSVTYSNVYLAASENGTSFYPFDTVAEANNEATDGADLQIKTGNYPETLTFRKRMRIIADGGPVTIGR